MKKPLRDMCMITHMTLRVIDKKPSEVPYMALQGYFSRLESR